MTPLAIIAKEAGFKVTGSDIGEEFVTDYSLKKAGITPEVGFSENHIANPDLVITTGAHNGFDNVEVKRAKEKGIKVRTAGEAAGDFMGGKIFNRSYRGISVCGTHGKTTTSAMIATILTENKLDPSFLIGAGSVCSLGSPGHFGKGKYFVAEADEYANEPHYDKTAKFLLQHPEIIVMTNIEFDHPDIYNTLEDIYSVYLKFANQLPKNGMLIACGDDHRIRRLLKDYRKPFITYGFSPENNYVLTKVNISGDHMFFWVEAYGKNIGEFMTKVVGEHNALNSLAAFIAALESGVSMEKARSALLSFTGTKRRLEYIGELATGAQLYDDYAHHPTEIIKTLSALRKKFMKKKIICVFQPHTYSRTKKLFNEFTRAFDNVDTVILSDIYASSREPFDPEISSGIIKESMSQYHRDVIYLPGLSDIIDYISQSKFGPEYVIVTMGAGDIYKIHRKLKLKK